MDVYPKIDDKLKVIHSDHEKTVSHQRRTSSLEKELEYALESGSAILKSSPRTSAATESRPGESGALKQRLAEAEKTLVARRALPLERSAQISRNPLRQNVPEVKTWRRWWRACRTRSRN